MLIMREHLWMAAPGRREAIAVCAYCAAAPGTTFLGTCSPRSASGTTPRIGTSSTVSMWSGRSLRESLPPYLLGGFGGLCPPQENLRDFAYHAGYGGIELAQDSTDRARDTGPVLAAYFRFLLWLVPAKGRSLLPIHWPSTPQTRPASSLGLPVHSGTGGPHHSWFQCPGTCAS